MGCSSSSSQSAFIPKLASKPACHPYSTFTFLAKDKSGADILLTDILNNDHELEHV